MSSILETQLEELQSKLAIISIYREILKWKDIPNIDDKFTQTSSSAKVLESIRSFCEEQITVIEGNKAEGPLEKINSKPPDALEEIKGLLTKLIPTYTDKGIISNNGAFPPMPVAAVAVPLIDQYRGKQFHLVGISNVMPSKVCRALTGSEIVKVLEVDESDIAKVVSGNGMTFFVPTQDLTT